MRAIILSATVMLVGCGKKETPAPSKPEPSTPQAAGSQEPELSPGAIDPSLAGTYQVTLPNGTFTLKLLEDGKAMVEKVSNTGVKDPESSGTGTWSVKNGEVMVESEEEGVDEIMIFKINPGGTLTPIANITDGKREDVPERIQKFMVLSKPLTIPEASPPEAEPVTPGDKGKKHEQITIGNETAAWISDPNNPQKVLVEKRIRRELNKPTGVLIKADLEKVENLSLSLSKINDEGLKEVAKLKEVRFLSLIRTDITDAGLIEVGKLLKLVRLSINATLVTDAGLKEVAKLQQLITLGLSTTQVRDEGLKELAKLKNLSEVNLRGTKVTKAGVAALKKALPDCNILHDAKK